MIPMICFVDYEVLNDQDYNTPQLKQAYYSHSIYLLLFSRLHLLYVVQPMVEASLSHRVPVRHLYYGDRTTHTSVTIGRQ